MKKFQVNKKICVKYKNKTKIMKFQIYRKFVHIIGRGGGSGIHKESHIKKKN